MCDPCMLGVHVCFCSAGRNWTIHTSGQSSFLPHRSPHGITVVCGKCLYVQHGETTHFWSEAQTCFGGEVLQPPVNCCLHVFTASARRNRMKLKLNWIGSQLWPVFTMLLDSHIHSVQKSKDCRSQRISIQSCLRQGAHHNRNYGS